MKYKGLFGLEREKLTSDPLAQWSNLAHTYKMLSDLKTGHLCRFDERFINKFHPYFLDFANCMNDLLDVLFETIRKPDGSSVRDLTKCTGNYDGFLQVLRHTFGELPNSDNMGPPQCSPTLPRNPASNSPTLSTNSSTVNFPANPRKRSAPVTTSSDFYSGTS